MVPAHLIWLDSMPLTSSGKVNRRALPRPERVDVANAETFVAPRTPLEELVAGIWAELLGLPRVGVLDNFFQLGGHSLLAMQVVARLQSTLGIALPVRALFESPTVAGLALLVLERLAGPEDSAFCGSGAIILE
jgi:acyl carrier protein